MKPTEILMHDHEAIKVMLQIMSHLSEDIRSGKPFSVEDVEKIIDFLRIFADKCHHGKEENVFFPALVNAGMSNESGPVAVMLHEHREGRDFIKGMASSVEAFKEGNQKASVLIAKNMEQYVGLLTNHIQKENNILFPMGDRMLDNRQQDLLLEQFEQIESEVIGKDVHEQYHELLHRFRDKYLKQSL